MGVGKIAVVAPYPMPLIEAGSAYWASWGIHVTAIERVVTRSADTRTIYELGSADAEAALGRLDPKGAEAVLLSGTGLPTLPALRSADIGLPLFTSNGCLAARLMARLGREDLLDPHTLRIAGWDARLSQALPKDASTMSWTRPDKPSRRGAQLHRRRLGSRPRPAPAGDLPRYGRPDQRVRRGAGRRCGRRRHGRPPRVRRRPLAAPWARTGAWR